MLYVRTNSGTQDGTILGPALSGCSQGASLGDHLVAANAQVLMLQLVVRCRGNGGIKRSA